MEKWIIPLLAVLMFCCSKEKPTNIQTEQINLARVIVSEVMVFGGSSYEYAGITADPMPDPVKCTVAIFNSGERLAIPLDYVYAGTVVYSDTIPLPNIYNPCSLAVKTNLGDGHAGGIFIPDSTTILYPLSGTNLPWNELSMVWSSARSANWYSLNISYSAYNGTSYLGSFDTTMFVKDTIVVLPLSVFQHFENTDNVYAFVYIMSSGGIQMPPETSGNISGAYKGYFLATRFAASQYISFTLNSTRQPVIQKQHDINRIIRTRFPALLKQIRLLGI